MPFSEENIHRITDEAQLPLTDEQRDLLAREMHRSVRKALHTYTRNAVVGFLILLAVNVFVWRDSQALNKESRNKIEQASKMSDLAVVRSGRAVSIGGCNRDFRTIQTLRGVLKTSKAFNEATAKRGEISPDRLARVKVFYDQQLDALKLPDCTKSSNVLTSDNHPPIHAPEPLHP